MPKSHFYIADNISAQTDGKVAIIGLYPDRQLVYHPPEEFKRLAAKGERVALTANLSMLLVVSDLPAGTYQVTAILATPTEEMRPDFQSMEFEVIQGKSNNLIFNLQPLQIKEPGEYALKIKAGAYEFEGAFSILFE